MGQKYVDIATELNPWPTGWPANTEWRRCCSTWRFVSNINKQTVLVTDTMQFEEVTQFEVPHMNLDLHISNGRYHKSCLKSLPIQSLNVCQQDERCRMTTHAAMMKSSTSQVFKTPQSPNKIHNSQSATNRDFRMTTLVYKRESIAKVAVNTQRVITIKRVFL